MPPANLTREILTRMHVTKNMHFDNDQLIKIFALNFYNPDISKIAKQVRSNCIVCTLCQNNYENKYSGEMRESKDLSPGESWVYDNAYLPKDSAGYLVAQPLKTLNSESTTKALQQFLLHIPAAKKILVDGGPEWSGSFP